MNTKSINTNNIINVFTVREYTAKILETSFINYIFLILKSVLERSTKMRLVARSIYALGTWLLDALNKINNFHRDNQTLLLSYNVNDYQLVVGESYET